MIEVDIASLIPLHCRPKYHLDQVAGYFSGFHIPALSAQAKTRAMVRYGKAPCFWAYL